MIGQDKSYISVQTAGMLFFMLKNPRNPSPGEGFSVNCMLKTKNAMKRNVALTVLGLITMLALHSCSNKGISDAVGGDLPTNYIIIKDTSFEPVRVVAVRNSTFTFVNHSGAVTGIYSADSMVINKQNIAVNKSYIFKKDTVGTIIYRMAGKPTVTGSIIITP